MDSGPHPVVLAVRSPPSDPALPQVRLVPLVRLALLVLWRQQVLPSQERHRFLPVPQDLSLPPARSAQLVLAFQRVQPALPAQSPPPALLVLLALLPQPVRSVRPVRLPQWLRPVRLAQSPLLVLPVRRGQRFLSGQVYLLVQRV